MTLNLTLKKKEKYDYEKYVDDKVKHWFVISRIWAAYGKIILSLIGSIGCIIMLHCIDLILIWKKIQESFLFGQNALVWPSWISLNLPWKWHLCQDFFIFIKFFDSKSVNKSVSSSSQKNFLVIFQEANAKSWVQFPKRLNRYPYICLKHMDVSTSIPHNQGSVFC